MGLFSGGARGLFGSDPISKLARAQALMGGDYGSAAGIQANMQDAQAKRAKAESAAAQTAQLDAQIDADPNLSPQDKVYAKANPKAYIEQYMTRFQQRQFGAAGGSIVTPKSGGGYDTYMAPSRHEFQGSVFDVSGGPSGSQSAVTPQHEGTQWVTPQPGTKAFGVNSFTGARRSGAAPDGFVQPDSVGGAPRVQPTSESINYLRQNPGTAAQFDEMYGEGQAARVLGGASPTGSRTFP